MDFKQEAQAEKFLGKQTKKNKALIASKIKKLDNFNPKKPPPKVAKLQNTGTDERWRIRAGNYRIIFTIDEAAKILIIIRIEFRPNVYKGL